VLKKPVEFMCPKGRFPPKDAPRVDLGYALGTWIVFADRHQVPIYDSPMAKKKVHSAMFLDAFYVIGEEDSLVLLQDCKAENAPDNQGEIHSKSRPLGWAFKKDLILWEKSLFSSQFAPVRRIFPVVNRFIQTTSLTPLAFYINPKKNTDSAYYYYIVKELNNKLLVSKSQYFGFPNQQNILGWFDKDLFFEWYYNDGIVLKYKELLSIDSLNYFQQAFLDSDSIFEKDYVFLPRNKEGNFFVPWLRSREKGSIALEHIRQVRSAFLFKDFENSFSYYGYEIKKDQILKADKKSIALPKLVVDRILSKIENNAGQEDSLIYLGNLCKTILGELTPEFSTTQKSIENEQTFRYFGRAFKFSKPIVVRNFPDKATNEKYILSYKLFLSGLAEYLKQNGRNFNARFSDPDKQSQFVLLPY